MTRTEAAGSLMIETETDLERRIKPIQTPLIGGDDHSILQSQSNSHRG
jgi:hypothetical protein